MKWNEILAYLINVKQHIDLELKDKKRLLFLFPYPWCAE